MPDNPACKTDIESLRRTVLRDIKDNLIVPIPPIVDELLGIGTGNIELDGQDLNVIGPKKDVILLSVAIPINRLSRKTLESLCKFARENEG